MSKTIPAFVTVNDVNEALGPFYELLGINKCSLFASPGIHFSDREITFVVPAVPEERWGTKRPLAEIPDVRFHPQVGVDNDVVENMLAISVEVVR